MTMDSNAVENLIGMMMISSNSSSSGSSGRYDGDAAAEEKKRRFSEAQVRSLEMMFETQAKLEPRKKQQLAKELGLQPRQVAIWFQNKRARWKSKQLERAYAALRADYDALHSSFDSLLLQKNALSLQVQRLAEMLGTKPQENSKEEKEEHCKQRNCSEADKITPALSLSSNANNSDEEEKKLNTSLDEDEVARHRQTAKGGSSSLISEDIEQPLFCFNAMGWPLPSDPLMAGGGGCSQWWEFLSYE